MTAPLCKMPRLQLRICYLSLFWLGSLPISLQICLKPPYFFLLFYPPTLSFLFKPSSEPATQIWLKVSMGLFRSSQPTPDYKLRGFSHLLCCPCPPFSCLFSFLYAIFLLLILQSLYMVYKEDFLVQSAHLPFLTQSLTSSAPAIYAQLLELLFLSLVKLFHLTAYPPLPVVPISLKGLLDSLFNWLEPQTFLTFEYSSMCITSFHSWGYQRGVK